MTHELRLTPGGQLRWQTLNDDAKHLAPLQKHFAHDWREGLFSLAAAKYDVGPYPTLVFWQEFASQYLTALCHVSPSVRDCSVPAPDQETAETLAINAPPMVGGEYLTAGMLVRIWKSLDRWVVDQSTLDDGLDAFLHTWAPKWRQVGQVCFHLAENPADPERPFAFLSTYAQGFSTDGSLKHQPLRNALEQFAGDNKRSALLKLLTPVERAAKACPWLREMVDSGAIYHATAWTAAEAYRLLLSAETLEECGLALRLPNWWKKRPRPQIAVTIGEQRSTTLGASAVLDFKMEVALGDEALSREEVDMLLEGGDGLVFLRGQWIEVSKAKLTEALAHWQVIEREAQDGHIDFIEGMRLLAGASRDLRSDEHAEEERPWVHVAAGEAMHRILTGLRDPASLEHLGSPTGLHGELRPYQRDGLNWLHFLSELGLGACLADDMGLGKTVQVLAAMLVRRRSEADGERPPALLVVPASLLGNWKSESNRFTPSLSLAILHTSEMEADSMDAISDDPEGRLRGTDLVMTTYGMVTRLGWLSEFEWDTIILDEAQAIKNPATRQSKAIKKLRGGRRIALTGTPIENRLGDLWSLFDFLNPGLLGSATQFKGFLKSLESREHDHYAPLRKLVNPYILRRLKTDRAIISDLPDKTETSRFCNLTPLQIKLYQHTVNAMANALESSDGMARRGLVLKTLTRLKQICNHPSQLTGDGGYNAKASGKFQRLAEICEELAERQERVLIFTQFREIIPALGDHLASLFGRPGLALHGGTSVGKRRALVEQFQEEDGPPFFILSIKAGGTGLNLTAASHVIHFDRWWNPAVENQATDRAFRIGQRKNVLVHKFVTLGTIEERIDALIEEKRQLSAEILSNDGEINLTELSNDELMKLVRLDVNRASI